MTYKYCKTCGDVGDAEQHLTSKQCEDKFGEPCPDEEEHHVADLIEAEDEFSGA